MIWAYEERTVALYFYVWKCAEDIYICICIGYAKCGFGTDVGRCAGRIGSRLYFSRHRLFDEHSEVIIYKR